MQPSQIFLTLARAMFTNAWEQRSARSGAVFAELKRDVAKIDEQTEGLRDRNLDASTSTLISAYVKRISKMKREKLIIEEKLENGPKPKARFDELFELAWELLSNLCKIWDYGHLTLQRTVLRLAFTERSNYNRNGGFRTPKLSSSFNMLGE